jgi:hypothetical protein
MAGGHLPPYWCSGLVVNLACKACSIWVVDISHHIWAVDWWSIWLARPVKYGWWTSTTIFGQWTGDHFGLQGLFNMGGGHLPPNWCSGLVVNLPCSVHRIRARSVRYGWWTSTTIFVRWTGDQFGLQGLFNMAGGHLPPYWCSGLVVNLACKACSRWVVNIYHHSWEVDW